MPAGPRLSLVTAPSVEPVTLSEMKDFLRIDDSNNADDPLLTALITAARRKVEEFTERALISQTWDVFHDYFPRDRQSLYFDGVKDLSLTELVGESQFMYVPRPPLISITGVYTTSPSNVETEFDSANYFVDTESDPGRVILNDSQIWPTELRNYHAVRIRFVAGYGTAASDVPTDIVAAMKILIGHLYEERGCGDLKMSDTIKAMLMPYKMIRLS